MRNEFRSAVLPEPGTQLYEQVHALVQNGYHSERSSIIEKKDIVTMTMVGSETGVQLRK